MADLIQSIGPRPAGSAAEAREIVETALRQGFLFTGVEETGMHGARSFVASLATGEADKLIILNLDMIGAGDALRVVTSEGVFRKRATDARLNRILFEAAPQATELRATQRSGDFAPFLAEGIPASSIEISGSSAAARAYHTVNDDLSLIEEGALAMAAEVVGKFVARLTRALVTRDGFG